VEIWTLLASRRLTKNPNVWLPPPIRRAARRSIQIRCAGPTLFNNAPAHLCGAPIGMEGHWPFVWVCELLPRCSSFLASSRFPAAGIQCSSMKFGLLRGTANFTVGFEPCPRKFQTSVVKCNTSSWNVETSSLKSRNTCWISAPLRGNLDFRLKCNTSWPKTSHSSAESVNSSFRSKLPHGRWSFCAELRYFFAGTPAFFARCFKLSIEVSASA